MQEREFENLINGEDAKWAPGLFAPANVYNGNDIERIEIGYASTEPTPEQVKQQLVDQIKIHQVEIPNDVKERVRKFVKKLTDQGKAARFIRRAVMREFNIKVV